MFLRNRRNSVRNGLRVAICMFIPLFFLLVVSLTSDSIQADTIIVDDDGDGDYNSIQEAVDNASAGDVIRVWDGTYYENVVVNKTVSLVGNGSEVTTIDGAGRGNVVNITADWVNISGLLIAESAGYGLYSGIVITSNHTNVFQNEVSNNHWGIYLSSSRHSTIENNTCSSNDRGIFDYYSIDSTILNNTCSNNIEGGIRLWFSSQCSVMNNTCLSNGQRGIAVFFSNNSTLGNNTCSSNNGDGIAHQFSNNCTIRNNICSSNDFRGIGFTETNFCKVMNNTCLSNSIGIFFYSHSSNNTIVDNIISENGGGIYLELDSQDNIAHYNNIFNNTEYGINATNNNGLFINATNNWWGDKSGPYHLRNNPMGKGNAVSDDVIFHPWLLEEPEHKSFDGEDDADQYANIPIIVIGICSVSLFGLAFRREDIRFILLSTFGGLLYSKMRKDDIMRTESRKNIFNHIAQNPGVNFSTIMKDLRIGTGNAVYHLSVLEREGYVISKSEVGRRLFFPRDIGIGPYPNDESLILSVLQKGIIHHLQDYGPATMTQIEKALSQKQTTVNYNIRKLMERGLVIREGGRRNGLYSVKRDMSTTSVNEYGDGAGNV